MMFVVVSYDVNEKRVVNVQKFLSKYLRHVQLSVFEGEIGGRRFRDMVEGLKTVIDPTEDSVRIYIFEEKDNVGVIYIGPREETDEVI